MIPVPSTNNFDKRFSWYRWSAPIYENSEEVLEAIKKSAVIGKRLKSVRIIGEATPSFFIEKSQQVPGEGMKVNSFVAQEPFIFEFEDGTSLEFLPHLEKHARLACSTIPDDIKDGLSPCSPLSQEYFVEIFGERWRRYALKNVEVVNIDHSKITFPLRAQPEENQECEILYRFKFENDCCFEFRCGTRRRKYEVFFKRNWEGSILYSQLKTKPVNHISWEIDSFGGAVNLYPYVHEDINESDFSPTSSLETFILDNWWGGEVCVDGEALPMCLCELFDKHLDKVLNQESWTDAEPVFEFYGQNLFPYENMRRVVSDVRDCIEKLNSNTLTAEEKKEVLQWAVRAFYHKVEVTENESQRLLKDFLEVFCESVEGMMNLCPHADGICVMGP
ncbi:hypothetical protein [Turicimonas muris]|uniref:hypothetical protein n=3 Tax=Turicimonas muris TaxID=1796652 RepID=UPI00248BE88D|nr:hypothetical protein [Turicimonas muris]